MALDTSWFDRWDKNVGGWFNRLEAEHLYDTVLSLPRNAKIVEIGSYRGRSTLIILKACMDSEKEPACLVCVDNFSGDGSAVGATSDAVKTEWTTVLRHTIHDWQLDTWLDRIDAVDSSEWFNKNIDKVPVDMFFIDGCHLDVDKDCSKAWSMLRQGGKLLCHDYDPGALGGDVIRLIDSLNLGGSHIGVSGTSLYEATKK